MPLTREFKETFGKLCEKPKYRQALLREILELYLSDDDDVCIAYSHFRDYLNATGSFARFAEKMGIEESSLRRMFGKNGNPTGRNLSKVFRLAWEQEAITAKISCWVMETA
mgnify:CR=1 FL=1